MTEVIEDEKKQIQLSLDLTAFVYQLRSSNGFQASEFKKYASYCTSLMPQLRKLSCPAAQSTAAQKPFFYKPDFLNGNKIGMVFCNELVQLVVLEAERALAHALEIQKFLQSDSDKLNRVSFIRLRKRVYELFERIQERYMSLQQLLEIYGTVDIQIQNSYFRYISTAILQQEKDDFFSSISNFNKADQILDLLKVKNVEQQSISQLKEDLSQRLQHCLFMAQAFAADDSSVLSMINQDALRAKEDVIRECEVFSGDSNQQIVKQSVISIYSHSEMKEITLTVPSGAVSKAVVGFQSQFQDILLLDVSDNIAALQTTLVNAAENEVLTPTLPICYAPLKRKKVIDLGQHFKMLTKKVKVLQTFNRQLTDFAEKPHPPDMPRLKVLLEVVQQELRFLQQKLDISNILNQLLQLGSGRFQGQRRSMQKSCLQLIKSELRMKEINDRQLASLGAAGKDAGQPLIKALIALYFLDQIDAVIKCPEDYVFRNASKDAEIEFPVHRVDVKQTKEVEVKKSGKMVKETQITIDLVKQQQLSILYRQKLLTFVGPIFFLIENAAETKISQLDTYSMSIFNLTKRLNLSKLIFTSLEIDKQREICKPVIKDEVVVLPVLLPNPIFFDSVGENLTFDSIFWGIDKKTLK